LASCKRRSALVESANRLRATADDLYMMHMGTSDAPTPVAQPLEGAVVVELRHTASDVRRRATHAEWLRFVDVVAEASALARELADESGDARMRAQAANVAYVLDSVLRDASRAPR